MALTTPIMKPCDRCGKVFLAKWQGADRRHQRYCERSCYRDTLKFTDEQALEVMWSRIDRNGPDGCWIYTAKANIRGYGTMVWRGERKMLVHRLLYQLAHGNLAGSHVFCLHKCDNPRCVNPAHIFLGDDAANTADKVSKRRHSYGERNRHAKLTEEQVQAIRAEYRYERGRSNHLELLARYGIKGPTLNAILSGRTWKHLPHTPIKPRAERSR